MIKTGAQNGHTVFFVFILILIIIIIIIFKR